MQTGEIKENVQVKTVSMASLVRKYAITIIGVALGAVAGYAYYHYIGCASGTCAITSDPLNSSLYGALLGGLIADSFRTNKKTKKQIINKAS